MRASNSDVEGQLVRDVVKVMAGTGKPAKFYVPKCVTSVVGLHD